MAMFKYILPLLFGLSVLREVSSRTWRTTIPTAATTWRTTTAKQATSCATPACPSCPQGYQIYYIRTYQCQYSCMCEVSRTSTTTLKPSNSMSKSLLLSILHNIQNNANALEQMAVGLSDEADLAQEAAALPYK